MKRILVTGATGTVGRGVVEELLRMHVRVRALTREPGLANLPAGAEVMRGDLTDPISLDAALADIDTVFLVWTAAWDAASAAVTLITRRARRVVFLTSPHQTPHPLFQQPNPLATFHASIEELIQDSGAAWTFLRPGMFAANAVMWWADQIKAGDTVRWPYGDAPTAPIDERDIAAVGARVLFEDGHDGGSYVLTGPESLTQRQQVLTIGEVIGRSLKYDEISPDTARREWQAPPAAVNMLLNAWAAAVGHPAFVTDSVETLTGNRPRTFRQWALDHAEAFTDRLQN